MIEKILRHLELPVDPACPQHSALALGVAPRVTKGYLPAAEMCARTAHWWIAGLSIIAYFWLLSAFAVNIPVDDDYDEVFGFNIHWDHRDTFMRSVRVLLSQHSEHRLVFSHVVYLLERQVAGGTDLRRLIFIGNFAWLVLFLLLLSIFRGSPIFSAAVALCALFLFQPAAYEGMFWAMVTLENNYVLVFALLSFILVSRNRYLWGAFFACVSLYTQANGILVVLLDAAWMFLRMLQGKGSRRQSAVAILMCAGAIALYSADYVRPLSHPPLWESLRHPMDTGLFLLAILGSSVGYLGLDATIAAGGGLIGLFAYLTYRQYFAIQPILYAFILFLFGSAATVAIGRYWTGVDSVLSQSRYAVSSNCLFACMTVAMVSLVSISRRRLLAGVQIGVVGLALVHACAAYASNLPAIRERRDRLIAGAAVFAAHGITAGLLASWPLRAGRSMRYMIDHGYYRLPQLPNDARVEAYKPGPVRLKVVPILIFALREYRGDKLVARSDGSMLKSFDRGAIHLKTETDIPEQDPEVIIYVATPVLPTSVMSRELEPVDVAPGSGARFEVIMSFPPDIDPQTLANEMCIVYESTSVPATLFRGNVPFCEERLVGAIDGVV